VWRCNQQTDLFNTQYDIAKRWKPGDDERRQVRLLTDPASEVVESALHSEQVVLVKGESVSSIVPKHFLKEMFKKCGKKRTKLFMDVSGNFVPEHIGGENWNGGEAPIQSYYTALKENEADKQHVPTTPLSSLCLQVLETFQVPTYLQGDVSQDLPVHEVEGVFSYRDNSPGIFMGPKGSGRSLHLSPIPSHTWLLILEGRIQIRVYPHSSLPVLYFNYIRGTFPVRSFEDFLHGDLSAAFPLARVAKPWDLMLKPGELLIIPSGMPYELKYLDNVVGLTGKYADSMRVWRTVMHECTRLAHSNASSGIFQPAHHYTDDARRIARSAVDLAKRKPVSPSPVPYYGWKGLRADDVTLSEDQIRPDPKTSK